MTEELRRLYDGVPHDVGVALCEAYRLGLNAGLASKFTDGTFEWAVQQMRQGNKVRRRVRAFPWLLLGKAGLETLDGPDKCQLISLLSEHIMATDWEIVPEPNPEPEGHDFAWAAEQVKNGKTVRRTGWGTFPWSVGANATVTISDTLKTDWVLAWEGQSK